MYHVPAAVAVSLYHISYIIFFYDSYIIYLYIIYIQHIHNQNHIPDSLPKPLGMVKWHPICKCLAQCRSRHSVKTSWWHKKDFLSVRHSYYYYCYYYYSCYYYHYHYYYYYYYLLGEVGLV